MADGDQGPSMEGQLAAIHNTMAAETAQARQIAAQVVSQIMAPLQALLVDLRTDLAKFQEELVEAVRTAVRIELEGSQVEASQEEAQAAPSTRKSSR